MRVWYTRGHLKFICRLKASPCCSNPCRPANNNAIRVLYSSSLNFITRPPGTSGGDALYVSLSHFFLRIFLLRPRFSCRESPCSKSLTASNKEGKSQQIAFQFRLIIQSALKHIKNDKIETTPDGMRVPEFPALNGILSAFGIIRFLLFLCKNLHLIN